MMICTAGSTSDPLPACEKSARQEKGSFFCNVLLTNKLTIRFDHCENGEAGFLIETGLFSQTCRTCAFGPVGAIDRKSAEIGLYVPGRTCSNGTAQELVSRSLNGFYPVQVLSSFEIS